MDNQTYIRNVIFMHRLRIALLSAAFVVPAAYVLFTIAAMPGVCQSNFIDHFLNPSLPSSFSSLLDIR